MRYLILLVSFFSLYSVAETVTTNSSKTVGGTTTVDYKLPTGETKDCQVENGPGVIMYGLCYKEANIVIFKSCADFTCQLDKEVTASPLAPGSKSCFTDKDPSKFKTSALAEHQVSNINLIKECGYGEKKHRGEK